MSRSIVNGFVIIDMPGPRNPDASAAFSAYPVMKRIFRSGRSSRPASATCRPLSPGRPISVTVEWDMYMINPFWGILSTPVINLASHTLYCVSTSSVDGDMNNAVYTLHSLNLADGSDQGPPLVLNGATYQPPGDAPLQTLGSVARKQRPALTLITADGHATIFIPFGSFKESASTNLGWVIAVDVSNPARPAIAAAWTTGSGKYAGAGIWQAGQGLSADEALDLHDRQWRL